MGLPMVNVLVCVKRVPDSTEEVVLTEDGQSVDGTRSGFTMSAHEECAVELAVQVAAGGGEATVLTLGDADAVEQLRNALAVGCTAATHVLGRAAARSARSTSPARSRRWSVTTRPTGATHDLVLLGNDAADSGDFQVGIRLAYELGRPVVNGAQRVVDRGRRRRARSWWPWARAPRARRPTACRCPPIVTIREGGVEPRYPSVPGRLKAKKVPDRGAPAGRPSRPGGGRVRLVLPPPTPSAVQILGEGPEAAPAVVDLLEKLGVLEQVILTLVETDLEGAATEVSLEAVTFARDLSAAGNGVPVDAVVIGDVPVGGGPARRAGGVRRPHRAPRRRRRASRRTPGPAGPSAILRPSARPPARSW